MVVVLLTGTSLAKEHVKQVKLVLTSCNYWFSCSTVLLPSLRPHPLLRGWLMKPYNHCHVTCHVTQLIYWAWNWSAWDIKKKRRKEEEEREWKIFNYLRPHCNKRMSKWGVIEEKLLYPSLSLPQVVSLGVRVLCYSRHTTDLPSLIQLRLIIDNIQLHMNSQSPSLREQALSSLKKVKRERERQYCS